MRLSFEITTGPDERREIRQALQEAGVEACCLATSLKFATPQSVEEAKPRVELASQIGCPRLRVFCGPLEENLDREEALRQAGRRLGQVAPEAESAGVALCLETHDTVCKAADARIILDAAEHGNVYFNYDNMHPFRLGESLDASFAALGDRIRHTHFHDSLNAADKVEIKRLGEGELPMDDMFARLKATGYEGYLSGEWFGEQYGSDPDEALRAYHADMTELANRNGVTLA